jgi:HTH-type transcriptional regulator/antitoxin HigA
MTEHDALAALTEGLATSPLRSAFDRQVAERNLNQYQVEQYLDVQYRSLLGLLNGTAQRVDYALIIKLRKFLRLSSDEMEKLFLAQNVEAKKDDKLGDRVAFLTANFDIETLHSIKFLNKKDGVEQIENRIKSFFNLQTIEDYKASPIAVCFSKSKRTARDSSREFWVQAAHHHISLLGNPYDYSRKELLSLIPKIRVCTTNVEKGLLTVLQALFRVGVTVIYQPQVPGVQVRGATFSVNGKPAIVLTDFRKSYATLWFALIHELHHVLYDWEDIQKGVFHLTGEPDIFLLNEDKANDFAREFLFSKERSNYMRPFLNDVFTVKKYAQQNQVHPSIIWSFAMYDLASAGDKKAWARYKYDEPDVALALSAFNAFSWENAAVENARIYREEVFSHV